MLADSRRLATTVLTFRARGSIRFAIELIVALKFGASRQTLGPVKVNRAVRLVLYECVLTPLQRGSTDGILVTAAVKWHSRKALTHFVY